KRPRKAPPCGGARGGGEVNEHVLAADESEAPSAGKTTPGRQLGQVEGRESDLFPNVGPDPEAPWVGRRSGRRRLEIPLAQRRRQAVERICRIFRGASRYQRPLRQIGSPNADPFRSDRTQRLERGDRQRVGFLTG